MINNNEKFIKVSYEYGFIELPINVYQNSSPSTDSTEKNILVYENNTYSGSILANDIDLWDSDLAEIIDDYMAEHDNDED